jgi:hypothetical protein
LSNEKAFEKKIIIICNSFYKKRDYLSFVYNTQMAPKKKPGKESDDKKAKGKKNAEESDGGTEVKEDVVAQPTEITNSVSEISKPEPTPVQEEIVETKYEEPVLTSIIVER